MIPDGQLVDLLVLGVVEFLEPLDFELVSAELGFVSRFEELGFVFECVLIFFRVFVEQLLQFLVSGGLEGLNFDGEAIDLHNEVLLFGLQVGILLDEGLYLCKG